MTESRNETNGLGAYGPWTLNEKSTTLIVAVARIYISKPHSIERKIQIVQGNRAIQVRSLTNIRKIRRSIGVHSKYVKDPKISTDDTSNEFFISKIILASQEVILSKTNVLLYILYSPDTLVCWARNIGILPSLEFDQS